MKRIESTMVLLKSRILAHQSSFEFLKRRFVVTVLVSVLMFGGSPSQSAAYAQSEADKTDYKSELTSWYIESTGPNYVLQGVDLEEYPHGKGERIYVGSVESLGFAEISFFDDSDSPEQTIATMLRDFESASQDFEVIASGNIDSLYYALARFQLTDDASGYFYIEVAEDIRGNIDLSQSLYSINADFLEQLSVASQEITINGDPFLGEPVIDLDSVIADNASPISTPEPLATPEAGSYSFETRDTVVDVQPPIAIDFDIQDNEIEAVYLKSDAGYGIVAYVRQDTETVADVIDSVFGDAPTGSEAPRQLYLDQEADRAFGVYRIHTQGSVRIMVIEITHVGDALWEVQAMAVSESDFSTEIHAYQQSVMVNNSPFLNDIDGHDVEVILEDNAP